MHLKFRNVNDAFAGLVRAFHTGRTNAGEPVPLVTMPSRYGEVVMIEEPVTITYSHPAERVLLNPARDANPFFHLYEALWMLAGRNDVAPLAYYNKRMAEFSDDGRTLNGAYGYRWRRSQVPDYQDRETGDVVDQLKFIIDHLKATPYSRRAVLSMWNVEDDLLKIDGSKDVCCNLSACFAVRTGPCPDCRGTGRLLYDEIGPRGGKTGFKLDYEGDAPTCPACDGKPNDRPHALDLTVFNRSNDTVWGLAGANAVHFSVLQEYVAARLGLKVGVYNQVTNNLHIYTAPGRWEPEKWLEANRGVEGSEVGGPVYLPTRGGVGPNLVPLVKDPATFDRELPNFVARHSSGYIRRLLNDWSEPFLRDVAHPLLQTFHFRKDDPAAAGVWAGRVADDAWRTAAREWLARRAARKGVAVGD